MKTGLNEMTRDASPRGGPLHAEHEQDLVEEGAEDPDHHQSPPFSPRGWSDAPSTLIAGFEPSQDQQEHRHGHGVPERGAEHGRNVRRHDAA